MVADGADASRIWRRWADVTELFDASSDPGWSTDRDEVDHEVGSAPNDGHMAITLPDGRHAESGGSHGAFELGGSAAGADDSEFDQHAYLPINATSPQGQANGIPSPE
jgi:hypothetical protein